ncbi:MAG: PPOX class F420-dependent oxidoreductase [Anaerolineaceae bacterium]|nr:PPOX class F420-dependent oxidoreductase [Anaerolineaceae bacterium]MCB9099102.1 PPOX class F420-dependent oxidoreductase [Anaerolineales bacterium]
MFSEAELAYLKSQYLARLGTVSSKGQPTVDAVGFEFDGSRFYIGGLNLPGTRKYKNVAAGNTKVSLIIDDLESVQPWKPRQIKVHGLAEIVERDGQFGDKEYLAITPTVSWSFGIEEPLNYQTGKFAPKKIIWSASET